VIGWLRFEATSLGIRQQVSGIATVNDGRAPGWIRRSMNVGRD